tara:strand:- start:2043 stop:2243 length:201 start_codon:yes stop_codon:yes gene_type:complete
MLYVSSVELHEKLSQHCIEKVFHFSVGSSHNSRQVKLLMMVQYLTQIPSENGLISDAIQHNAVMLG